MMKKQLLPLCLLLLSAFCDGQNASRSFTFAWLSDVHLNSFAYAEDDLRQAIEDINAQPAIDFTLFTGDVTEFGDTHEFGLLQSILKNLQHPYLLLPGNHDVNWSENGCTQFNQIFHASHFCQDWHGIRFIGCGAGPSLRMGPPHIPREEINWLDSILRTTPAHQPIIFANHFPLNPDLSNWYEVIDLLKTRNIQVILSGHLHANRAYKAEGIPAAIGRSSLRRKDPIGGYNLVTWQMGTPSAGMLRTDTLRFQERIIKTETRPAWNIVPLAPPRATTDTVYARPDFALNAAYPHIQECWKRKDVTDIASQGIFAAPLYFYTNTAGVVHALNTSTGKDCWTYTTGNKIFSAPFVTSKLVIVSSCDGHLYALDKKRGTVRWSFNAGYPLVACPVVADESIYIGSSNGKFYSLNLKDGKQNWVCTGLQGYIESRPAVDKERVYIGTWGAMFYALNRHTGQKIWEFNTGRGRYFSPGACWPVVLQEQVIVLSSDYFVRAFQPETGKILWASDEAKGRESLGFSPDGKTMYIKGIQSNLTAVDISNGTYSPLWNITLPYKSNFIPTRMETTDSLVFIPTEFGVLHAVRTDGSGIAWSHKISHSAITSLQNAGPRKVIAMTMDGTVVCLEY